MNFTEFECVSRADGTRFHCFFIFLQTAISLRHSDTVDARFLVNGKRITVAMPHVPFVEHEQRHGTAITDNQAAGMAALYLKQSLEAGAALEDITVPAERVLELGQRVKPSADTLMAKQ
jgi:hypothetical protein